MPGPQDEGSASPPYALSLFDRSVSGGRSGEDFRLIYEYKWVRK